MTAALPMLNRHRLRGPEEGATAVETAIILSAFAVLVFGLVEFAQIFWTWNTMLLALEEGGRYAIMYNPTAYPDGPPAATCSVTPLTLANCAVDRAKRVRSAYLSPNVHVSSVITPTTMTIQGTLTYDFVVSGLLPYGPITMTQSVTVPLR